MGRPVAFGKGVVDDVLRQAAAAPAVEICGLLLGTPDRVERALPCRNVAADTAVAFEIDPAALIAALRAERGGGPTVLGCYHSHPRGRPKPSARDAAAAAANGWLWLIVGAGDARLFRAVQAGAVHGRFVEQRWVPSGSLSRSA